MQAELSGFSDTKIAFRSKSNKELRRARLLFNILAMPWLVKLSKFLVSLAMKAGIPVGWAVKPTIYRHFVGGSSLDECQPLVTKLGQFNVKGILDFSVEGKNDKDGIQRTLDETLRSIAYAAGNPNIPFAVFKPSAFASYELLEHASPGRQPEGKILEEYVLFQQRVNRLCAEAHRLNVPLMIDAEDSWYQHLVDETVEQMMSVYNREKAIVFNTLQMYRADRLEFLSQSIAKARQAGYKTGIKFVRGAYMEKERRRALEMGYPSPIHPDKAATDKAFNDALLTALDHLDILDIFCGSHNEESNLLLAREMDKHGIERNDNRIWFAQLNGMSDHISFNLAEAGYNVAKYIPYGPVKSVLPYLFRRAEENTSIAGQTSRELRLIQTEFHRRHTQ